jgi:hypothetical protein
MPLALNKRKNDVIEEDIEHGRASLAKRQQRNPGEHAGDQETHFARLADIAVELGLAAYQQELPKQEVVNYLALAAESLMKMYASRQNRAAVQTERNPMMWLLRDFGAVVCFGDLSRRRELGDLQRWKYDDETSSFGKLHPLIEAVQRHLRGETVPKSFEAALLEMRARKATSRDVEIFAPLGDALLGVLEINGKVWNDGLQKYLDWHVEQSLYGDWKLLPKAFIALPALGFAKLGIERGLTCTVQSPYLPLFLIE